MTNKSLPETTKKLNNWMGVSLQKNARGLYRVFALVDIPKLGIEKGDWGGWVNPDKITVADDLFLEGGRFYDGEFYGGEFYGGEFNGGKFYGGEFYGGEFYGGLFNCGRFSGVVSITLTRHPINISSPTDVTIGCENHPIDWWLENYKSVADDNGYSESDVSLYLGALQYLKANWDLLAPKVPAII